MLEAFICLAIGFGLGFGLGRDKATQPLTDAQIDKIWSECMNNASFVNTVRTVEKAHGIGA